MSNNKNKGMQSVSKQKPNKPDWQNHQQEETQPKNNEDREDQKEEAKGKNVTIHMLSDYRDVAKKGDDYVVDEDKAAELVKLGRAEYKKGKSKKEEPKEETQEEQPETLAPAETTEPLAGEPTGENAETREKAGEGEGQHAT